MANVVEVLDSGEESLRLDLRMGVAAIARWRE